MWQVRSQDLKVSPHDRFLYELLGIQAPAHAEYGGFDKAFRPNGPEKQQGRTLC